MSDSRMFPSRTLNHSSRPIQSAEIIQDAYLLHLASLSNIYATTTSSPLNSIQIYDKHTLRPVHEFCDAHPGGITFLRSLDHVQSVGLQESLMSSGKDGSICVWDPRTSSVSLKLIHPNSRALLCFDVSVDGSTVAAGTDLQGDDALICFWDPRQPTAPLVSHASTHSDDITSLNFSKTSSTPLLLSGSSDCLVSISNALEPDEDEAVLHVGNMGSSVSQAGWIFNHPKAAVWSLSDMECFSTWSAELDHFRTVDMKVPTVHSHDKTWVTDYVIGCHSSSSHPLGIFVGSNEGDIALVSTSLAEPSASWTLERLWAGSHVGIVRSCLWDEQNSVLLTCGEDSKLNLWPCPALSMGGEKMDVDML